MAPAGPPADDGGGPSTDTVAWLLERRAEDDGPALRFEGEVWSWRQVVTEARARAGLLARSPPATTARSMVASCSTTRRSTSSCWPGRPWPGPWSSGATRPGGARSWPGTSGATDCGSWSPTTSTGTCSTGSTWAWPPTGCSPRTPTTTGPRRRGRVGGRRRPASPAGPRRPLPAGVHLGVDRGPKAVRMSQGRAARAAVADALRPRRRPLLGHAPVPRQRPLLLALPVDGRRGHAGAAAAVLGIGVPARRPPARRHVHEHRRPGRRPHPGHRADRPRPRPPAQVRARSGDRRPPTRPSSPGVSASRCSRGTGRARARSCCTRSEAAGPARSAGCPRGRGDMCRRPGTGEERATGGLRRPTDACSTPTEAIGELIGRSPHSALRGLLQQPRGRGRADPRTAGTGRATWPTGTTTASSTSPGDPATGCASTARTSPPRRSSGSSGASPASAGSPSTPCPTPAPATR